MDGIPWLVGPCHPTLVLFRIGWGLVGSDTARFAHFMRGPRVSYAYLRSVLQRQPKACLGHNPLADG